MFIHELCFFTAGKWQGKSIYSDNGDMRNMRVVVLAAKHLWHVCRERYAMQYAACFIIFAYVASKQLCTYVQRGATHVCLMMCVCVRSFFHLFSKIASFPGILQDLQNVSRIGQALSAILIACPNTQPAYLSNYCTCMHQLQNRAGNTGNQTGSHFPVGKQVA